MQNTYDVIVLGLGAMGSASTYQLAKQGVKVLGVDQFSPPHSFGSTHGDSRITRQAIGEGEEYTPLSLRSYELWREIERETGQDLLTVTGGLIISSSTKTAINHVPNFFENTIAAAKKHGIKHSLLETEQIRKRFPQFKIKDNEIGYFEDNAGFLRPEACVASQIELAEKYGADIRKNEKVIKFECTNNTITVTTNVAKYRAEKLVITAGPWLPQLLEEYAKLFTVRRQVLYWFDVADSIEPFLPNNFPVFIWEVQGRKQGIYGFPAIDGPRGGVKIATEQYHSTTAPDTVERYVAQDEINSMYENYVKPHLEGLTNRCVKAVTCLYTITPNRRFIIDYHPKYQNVILASPCSGHGFKHSAAIGEVVSQLVVHEKSDIDISKFSLSRFNVSHP